MGVDDRGASSGVGDRGANGGSKSRNTHTKKNIFEKIKVVFLVSSYENRTFF